VGEYAPPYRAAVNYAAKCGKVCPMLFSSSGTRVRNRPTPVALLIFFFLLGIGPLITSIGITAVRTKYYRYEWEQSRDLEVSPIVVRDSATHGVDRYVGARALWVGTGLTAVGAMFTLWGLVGAWVVVRPASLEISPHLRMGLCIFSALLQTTALICILPPWRIGSGIAPVFWATVVLLISLVFLTEKLGLERQMKFWVKALIGLGVAAICVSFTVGNQSWLGIVVAVFVCASYAGHAIIVHGLAIKQPRSS
jgi:hypothetical protein